MDKEDNGWKSCGSDKEQGERSKISWWDNADYAVEMRGLEIGDWEAISNVRQEVVTALRETAGEMQSRPYRSLYQSAQKSRYVNINLTQLA